MKLMQKTPTEVHRDLLASGVFDRATQESIAVAIGVNQGTISRIENGDFKRVNKTVRALCKYAKVSNVRTTGTEQLLSLVASAKAVDDPEKRKLVHIIGLAVDLLGRP
ncbi:XRE family transcriptional regulator [Opitutaceae bacterium TAV4]|nr:XRE family transcriptional regulator [Opitutaceae bacterium TAV4]RRJ99740.1 XRE family transcriptional regulator [Opitutaceae bacterium TAV3]